MVNSITDRDFPTIHGHRHRPGHRLYHCQSGRGPANPRSQSPFADGTRALNSEYGRVSE